MLAISILDSSQDDHLYLNHWRLAFEPHRTVCAVRQAFFGLILFFYGVVSPRCLTRCIGVQKNVFELLEDSTVRLYGRYLDAVVVLSRGQLPERPSIVAVLVWSPWCEYWSILIVYFRFSLLCAVRSLVCRLQALI